MGNMADTFQKSDSNSSTSPSTTSITDGVSTLAIHEANPYLRRMESMHRTDEIGVVEKERVEALGMEEVDSKTPDRAKFLHRSVSKVVDENPEADKVYN
jgi:hypothetical protein